jgi:mono/diheme cytochrome c family protein
MWRRTLLLAAFTVALSSPAARADASLSDVMTKLQAQHSKLWFAGKFGNWDLAKYEIQQIEANLDATSKMSADPSQIQGATGKLQALRHAAESKDLPKFASAYADLTNECNSCHRRSGYSWISMQTPLTLPNPDQLFVDQVSEGRSITHASCGTCHDIPGAPKQMANPHAPAPTFLDIVNRPSFSADALRQFLASNHRRLGPDQTMPNPRLNEYQREAITAYIETLRAAQPH